MQFGKSYTKPFITEATSESVDQISIASLVSPRSQYLDMTLENGGYFQEMRSKKIDIACRAHWKWEG